MRVIIIAIMLIALFLLAGCNGSTSKKNVSLEFTEYTIEGSNVTLTYNASGEEGEYIVKMSDNNKITVTVPSTGTVTTALENVACDVTLTSKGTDLDAEIKFNNSLPQLTEAMIPVVAEELTNEELASLTVGDWNIAQTSGGATSAIERLGIPKTILADGPAGCRWGNDAVWYPSCSTLASSWDTEIAEKIGEDIGEDCVSYGIDVILGPGMNIQRSVLGGRNFEYMSEDPYLTGVFGAAYTNGVQKTGTGVSAKHYAVNNQETGRSSVSSQVTERALREIYLKGFNYLVKRSDPYTIMSSYNKVNGTYTSVNTELLSILRDEFGFAGVVMSDWGSGGSSDDKVAAGNDLTEPGSLENYNDVLKALDKGTLSHEDAVKAAINILQYVVKTNAYNNRTVEVTHEEQAQDALEAAEAGMVLLKNDDSTLPYNGSVSLFGSGSFNTALGGSGSGEVYISSENKITIYKGIENSSLTLDSEIAEAINNEYGNMDEQINDSILSYVNSTAENTGLAIVTITRKTCEGEDHSETKGDWYLSDSEAELIKSAAEAYHSKGGKVLVILNVGNPIEVASWEDYADAILWCGMAGEQTGNAVANIITGEVNPSGKLTCTWPVSYDSVPYSDVFPGNANYSKYYEDIYVGYRFNTTFNVEAQYEFGYGLSYTSFEYSDIKLLDGDNISDKDGTFRVSVKVKNTGSTAGREIVQLYVSKPSKDNIEQAALELCGFAKTSLLKPGKSETVIITVTATELETYNTDNSAWEVFAGEYSLSVGSSCTKIADTLTLKAESDITVQDVENKCVNTKKLDILTQAEGYDIKTSNKENLAKNATATANSDQGGMYPAENAVDGDKTTRWSGVGISGKRILNIDLNSVVFAETIEILWESNNAYKFDLEISTDGENWEKICDGQETEADEDSIDVGKELKYIRITVPASASWCSIYEVSVY